MPAKPVVLLVDDEPEILWAHEQAILRGVPGVVVLTATSGKEGLAALEKGPVDVIISDFRMPEMDGVEFLTRAYARMPTASRMMMTAFPETGLVMRALNDSHVVRFIPKPCPLRDLVANVQAVLADRAAREAKARAMAEAFHDALRS